jgi:CHAD domain-containing protein
MGKKEKAELILIFNAAIDAIDEPLNKVIALDDDIEAVHQYRVKIRQVRSLIAFFEPKLNEKTASEINLRLKNMASIFSKVRELDVLSQYWLDISDDQVPQQHDFGVALVNAKQQARVEAYVNFKAGQTKSDLTWIKEQFVDMFENDKRLSQFIEKRLCRWLISIRKDVKKLDIEDYPRMHQLRIRIKRLRYSLTLLNDYVDELLIEKIKPSKLWAEQLGVICDYQRIKEILDDMFVEKFESQDILLKSLKSEVDKIHEQLKNTKI